ncbi:hypothetical protein CAOG_06607 [Capsaspora owczarzaki ATCC 30864]|uniref:hypothetical protein n=1 Tax=Capsaspora owczarzaki (strain ATCC 30864) TaxID=595528 RepID=UPI0001FE4127|nr:hypothetical protein CAOG_06607 [Capsaspora owczarzaki ATCC 30864]|eukprot:XP_004344228.1 hypothetical protein CAOG_06607 [Capsaspora owczarzaki ATCC 30864]
MLDDFSNDSSPEDACDDSALLLGALPTQSSDIFTPGAAFSASQAQFSSQPSQQQPFPSTADSQPQQCSPAPLTVAQANTPFILKSQPVKPTTPFSKFSFALSQNLNFGGASAKKALDLANDDALSDIGALEHDDQHHALDSGVPLMPATPHTQQPPPSTLQLAVDMATTTPAAMRFFDLSHHSANNSAAIAGLSSARTALPPGVDYDSDALEFDDNDQTDAGEHADFPSTPPPRAPNESGDGATTLSAGAAWFKLTDPASSSSSSSFRTPRKDYHGASGVDASDMSPSSSHRRKRVQLVPAGLAERLEKLALAERSELSFWQYNNRRMASATASALGPSFTSAMQAAVPSVPLEDLLVVELLQDFVQCHCYFVRCKVVSGTTRSRVFTVNLANKLSTAAPSQPSQQLSQQSFAVVDILMDLVTCRRLSLTLGSKLELHPPWQV